MQSPGNLQFELSAIEPILDWARSAGADVDALLAGLNSHDTGKDGSERLVDLVDYFRIQRDIARSLDDLTAQLSERKLTYQTGSFVIAQLRSANTLNDAIRSLAQHFNMMHGDDYNRVRQSENTVALVVDDSSFPYRFRKNEVLTHFVGVALLIKVHCLLDSLSGGQAGRALRRIGLKQPRDGAKHSLVRFWQVPVSFGKPAYELVYDFDLACQSIPTATDVDLSADGIFARVIRHLEEARPADTRTFSARTEELVSDGVESQQAAADHFGMSVATLRRRLDEENTSFREIVLKSRLKRADELLARGASITQVSEQLGYSDVRAFNRAFRKIRGLSPSAYLRARKTQIGIAPPV